MAVLKHINKMVLVPAERWSQLLDLEKKCTTESPGGDTIDKSNFVSNQSGEVDKKLKEAEDLKTTQETSPWKR